MKLLLIIRHAKSTWDNPLLKDFDRPLNDRGHRDAPMMASRLKEKGIKIDAFVSSTANRALTTATYFAKTYEVKKENIIERPELYNASISDFFQVIGSLDDQYDTIALFSHNPGITDLVNLFTKVKIDNMPTCAVFAVNASIDSWAAFEQATKDFWFFDYPKNE
jgi:phosphohistidine phosphatase